MRQLRTRSHLAQGTLEVALRGVVEAIYLEINRIHASLEFQGKGDEAGVDCGFEHHGCGC